MDQSHSARPFCAGLGQWDSSLAVFVDCLQALQPALPLQTQQQLQQRTGAGDSMGALQRATRMVSVVETCPLGASATAQHTFTTPQASMQAVQDECVVLHESVRQAQEALGKMCAAAQQYEQARQASASYDAYQLETEAGMLGIEEEDAVHTDECGPDDRMSPAKLAEQLLVMSSFCEGADKTLCLMGKIASSVSLSTTSEELQTYITLASLLPHLDRRVALAARGLVDL